MSRRFVASYLGVCVVTLFAYGCGSARSNVYPAQVRRSSAAAFSPLAYSLRWILPPALSAEDPKLELGSDQTVGVGGMLGETVNEVVPIPGTDMVRVGVLQEGSLFQSSFRSPQQETTGQSGSVLNSATVVFRVFRPVR